MNWGKHFLEGATLIIAAVLCALVSNAVASRERKLVVVSQVSTPQRPAATTTTTGTTGGLKPAAPQIPAPAPVAATTSTAASQKTPLVLPIRSVKAATKPTQVFDPHPDKPYIELHGDDVAYLHSKGVLFLDARRTSVYEQGHIPGARSFSVWESDIDDKVNKLYAERPDPKDQNQPIVVYCSGGDCEDSHMLAQKLWGLGFNNVYVYKDGFPDWQKRGEPVHTGAAV